MTIAFEMEMACMKKISINFEIKRQMKWDWYVYFESIHEFEAEISVGPFFLGIYDESIIDRRDANYEAINIMMTKRQKDILNDWFDGSISYDDLIKLETSERDKYYSKYEGLNDLWLTSK